MAIGSKRRSIPWSAEEEAELRALVAANISRSRIAVRLQRTTTAIETKLSLIRRQRQQEGSDGDDCTVAGQAANTGPNDHNHWQTVSPSRTIECQ